MELSKEQAKENLVKLIVKFENELNLGKIWDYNEEATKTAFIQPLLKDVLGWDVNDRDEVSPEEKVSHGRVDYGLKIDNKIKIFVEAKPPKADLEKHIEQAVKYGYNRKTVPFVLLTDFEGLKLFDVTVKPDFRNLRKGLKIDLKWKQYLDDFDNLWLFSKESTQNGEIDKLIKVKPKDRVPVDKAILEDLKEWQEKLAKDIYKNNPGLFKSDDHEKNAHYLREITQRFLDRIIFMRFCEDRKFIHRPYLKSIFEERSEAIGTATMTLLRDEFKHYNIIFDSDLFRPQEWENGLLIDFRILNEIILQTYNPYQFDVIPLEVLGNIYEQYLGYTIRLTDHQVKYELKPDVRKAGGVYYTPEYIVDYIVKNTVGKQLQELPAAKIKKLRILDPACGSGSFLIRAYEEMMDWYKLQKKTNKDKAVIINPPPSMGGQLSTSSPLMGEDKGGGEGSGETPTKLSTQQLIDHEPQEHILSIEKKSQILREHIFGVDIDEQAVEVTKLSLMLKMLEGEFGIIPGRNILPMLDQNIKCGNSLISGDTLELKKYFGNDWYKVKAFNWKEEFRKIMVNEGGFDVVIGNPPWIDIKGLDPNLVKYCFSNYLTTSNRMNIFAVFIERSLQVIRQGGYFGYIIPNSILHQSSYEKLRSKILQEFTIANVVRMPDNVFKNVKAETVILVLLKGEKQNRFENEIIIFDRKSNLLSLNYQKALELKSMDQNLWNSEKYYAFNIFTSPQEFALTKKIESTGVPFDTLCDFTLGITPYDKYKGHTQKQISERNFHANKKEDKSCRQLLAGGDISRYYLKWNGQEWLKYGPWLGAPREERFFTQTRILVRQIISGEPPRIFATLTSDEYCNTQTIFNIIPKHQTEEDIKYILAILNSKIINYYHTQRYLDKSKILFQKILIQNTKQFPIRKINFSNHTEKKHHDDLVALVDAMLDLNRKLHMAKGGEKEQIQRQIEKTDKEIDELVYKLYGITDEERKIIERRDD